MMLDSISPDFFTLQYNDTIIVFHDDYHPSQLNLMVKSILIGTVPLELSTTIQWFALS